MCGEDANDISSVRCWVHHFNSGGKNSSNRPRSDPSAVEVTMETKDRVDAMILDNCCITTHELWATTGIGKPAVMAIIREVGNRRICAKLVLKMVTIDHKPAQRNITAQKNFPCTMRKTDIFSVKNNYQR